MKRSIIGIIGAILVIAMVGVSVSIGQDLDTSLVVEKWRKSQAVAASMMDFLIKPTALSQQGRWIQRSSGTLNDLEAIFFVNNAIGWAVGQNGTILKSQNGGETWDAQISRVNNWLYNAFFLNDSTGWICGDEGILLRTTNGGATWTSQDVGLDLYSVYFINAGTGYVAGLRGTLLKTINGGQNWTSINTGFISRLGSGMSLFASDSIIFVGTTSALFKSTNFGESWEKVLNGDGKWIVDIDFIDANSGYAVASYENESTVYHTQDGDSWAPQHTTNEWIGGIGTFADGCWAVGRYWGTIWSNRGGDWNVEARIADNLDVSWFALNDISRGCTVGENGGIWRYEPLVLKFDIPDTTVVGRDAILPVNYLSSPPCNVVSWQTNIQLPSGVALKGVQLDSLFSQGSLSWNVTPSNELRALWLDTRDLEIYGKVWLQGGELFRLEIEANPGIYNLDFNFANAILLDSARNKIEEIFPQTQNGGLTVLDTLQLWVPDTTWADTADTISVPVYLSNIGAWKIQVGQFGATGDWWVGFDTTATLVGRSGAMVKETKHDNCFIFSFTGFEPLPADTIPLVRLRCIVPTEGSVSFSFNARIWVGWEWQDYPPVFWDDDGREAPVRSKGGMIAVKPPRWQQVVEAEDMYHESWFGHVVQEIVNCDTITAWKFTRSGEWARLWEKVEFPFGGTYNFVVRARGEPFEGPPMVKLRLDVGTGYADSVEVDSVWGYYPFTVSFEAGTHRLLIYFPNDEWSPGVGDRNLLVDKVIITYQGKGLTKPTEQPEQSPEGLETTPNNFVLHQNYPNPFNPTTTISFNLPVQSHVTLTVFNIMGQEVATLLNGPLGAGQHNMIFDASNLPSGVYFCCIRAGKFQAKQSMLLMK